MNYQSWNVSVTILNPWLIVSFESFRLTNYADVPTRIISVGGLAVINHAYTTLEEKTRPDRTR